MKVKDYLKNNKSLVITFLLTVAIFICLYHKFIFSNYVYAYSVYGDLGSDTVHVYYPIFEYFSKILHGGNFDIYSLNLGLGGDIIPLLNYVANPFDFITLLFRPERLHYGLILSNFVKLLCISMFSFKYMDLIFKKNYSKIICALVWTFSSYIILWGQHYFFATNMVYFTIFVYFLHKHAVSPSGKGIKLIITMSFFALCSYYFFYMSGVFAVLYLIIYAIMKKDTYKLFFYRIIKLGILAISAVALVSFLFLPIVINFLNSARTSNLSFGLQLFAINLEDIITYIGRSLSTNVLGDAMMVNFSGTANYYEAPLLYSSVLVYFAATVFVLNKKIKIIKKLLFIIAYNVVLMIPFFTQILTFNASAKRWTFMLIFIHVLLIGKFLDDWLKDCVGKKKFVMITSAAAIVSVFILILFFYEQNGLVVLEYSEVFRFLCIFVTFSILICFHQSQKFQKILVFGVCCELVIMNYPSVNYRGIEKKEKFLSYYYDGTIEAVEEIKNRDASLYRIQKTYQSKHLNDALVQGYYGTNIYSSVNSQNLIDFFNSFSIPNIYQTNNCIEFSSAYTYLGNILATKYMISNNEILDQNYKELFRTPTKIVYENLNYLPFGTVYENEISKDEFDNLTQLERMTTLSKYYYVTEEKFEKNKLTSIQSSVDKVDLLKEKPDLFETTTIELDERDIALNEYDQLELQLKTKNTGSLTVYYDSGNGFKEDQKSEIPIYSTQMIYTIPLAVGQGALNKIKIVQNEMRDPLELMTFNLQRVNDLDVQADYSEARNHGLKNAVYEDNTLTGIINNDYGSEGMLFIPILYNDGWRAYIDGEEKDIHNINGGMLGIYVPNGEHNIELKYELPGLNLGITISTVSFFLLLLYSKFDAFKLLHKRKYCK